MNANVKYAVLSVSRTSAAKYSNSSYDYYSETSCFNQLLKKNGSSDCAVHHVDNQQKSRNSGNDSTQSQARFIKTAGKVSNTTTKSTQSGLVETIAVDPNREHDIKSIDTSCDLVITILLSHIDDIRF